MRKTTILIALAFATSAKAQVNPGISFGPTLSSLQSDMFESKQRIGGNVGISFIGYYSDKFQTISDFYMETAGGTITNGRVDSDSDGILDKQVEHEQKMGSFSFSLIGNYYFYKTNFGVQFGPHLNMISTTLGSSAKITEVYYGNKDFANVSPSSFVVDTEGKKFNYGLTFGLSGGGENFLLALRYNWGLRNLLDQGNPTLNGYHLKRNSVQLTFTYIIHNVEIF